MSMKYRLLLCVVVLLACTATLFAGTTQIYQQTFAAANADKGATDPLNYTKWTFGGNWAVIPVVSTKPGIPVSISPNGTAGLVYQKNGDYETNIDPAAYVTTLPISCAGKTSVQLSFLRSLTVEDSTFDQATVWVSNNGSAWTQVYVNPTKGKAKATDNTDNLTNPAWVAVSYDISTVADKQATVYLRWGIKSNNGNTNGGTTTIPNLHGWAVQDITLIGAAGDAFYAPALSGVTLPAGWCASGPIWEIGAPAVGTSGQIRDADGDPATPGTVNLGRDPGVLPAGALGTSIFGTLLGANYPAGMNASFADSIVPADAVKVAPQYLTWGPLDLTGLQATQLQFQRWLNIGSGNLDRVRIQAHINNTDLDNPDDPEVIKDDTTSNKINVGTPKVTYAVSTANHYAQGDCGVNNQFKVTFKYNTDKLSIGNEKLVLRYTLDNTASTVAWQPFIGGTVTTNTGTSSDNTVKLVFDSAAFQSKADFIKAQDNSKFAISAILLKTDNTALASDSTATATISEAKVVGVLWTDLFDNKASSPTSEILDDIGDGKAAWLLKAYSLPAGANDNDNVWVRWSIGPTDSGFTTEYGGWNIADPAIVEASRQWAATPAETIPAGLQWEKTNDKLVVPAKNTGTAVWDDSFSLYEVKGVKSTVAKPGEPSKTQDVIAVADPPSPISRWSVDSIDVSGTVAADASFQFKGTLTAPPLSSVVYASPVIPTVAADADLSNLTADWDLANETFDGSQDWLPTYRGTSIANGGIVTSRFPDDAPGTAGNWARFWTEELAGRVPMIVQGFGDGTYRPTNLITRDQIAVYMARARNLNQAGPFVGAPHFSDVQADNWAYGAIEACFGAGIVAGFPDHTYQPTQVITRDAMAKFVCLGAQIAPVPKDAATKDDQTAQVKAGWFPDVIIWDDPATTSVDERNVFRSYINALKLADVVTGYAQKDADGNTFFIYQPNNKVDRASLAVYVWRAFMRTNASAVVLGGPAITDVTIATDGAAPAVASYYGYSNAGSSFKDGPFKDTAGGAFSKQFNSVMVSSTAQNCAYVTFDAVRLAGLNLAGVTSPTGSATSLDVTFELRRVTGTVGPTSPALTFATAVPVATLGSWISNTLADPLGEPYRNVVWAIPTGLQGDFQLFVTVEGNVLSRQPTYSVRNGIYTYNFDSGAPPSDWALFGQPQSPGPKAYPTDYLSVSGFKANTDLYKNVASVELQQTQQIVRRFDTSNRHNIRLGIRYTQTGFGTTNSINIEWSYDYGSKGPSAHWTPVSGFPLTGPTAIGTKLQKDPVYKSLPNGSPNTDPVVIGADNNVDFAIRLSVNAGTNATPKAYFDTLTIDGT